MPEPITIVAGVTTIVGNVWRISKDVYELIDGVGNAPKHIFALAQDVRGLYGVLGSLQGLLQDLKVDCLPENVIPIFEGLQQPLDHCFWAFRELQMKICKYIKPTGDPRQSKWAAFRWQFTEKDTNVYRSHLASYKLTVDVALATANLANTSQNIQATASLEFQIQAMRIQLEGFEQNNADGPCGSVDVDNGSQTTDRQFALRRFLESAETAFSGSPPVSPTLSARRDRSFSPPRRQSAPLEVELDAAAGRYSRSEPKLDSAYSTRQYTEELNREASPPTMKTNVMAEGLSNVPPTVAPEHPAMHHHPSSLLAEKKKSPTRFNETGRPIIFSARALYAYHAVIPEELSFEKGDTLTILRLQDDGWWEAEVEGKNSKPGLAPSNYLSRLEDLPESLSTPLTGTPGTTKSENVRRPTNYRPFVEDGSELPTRRRSRPRDNAGKGSGNVAGPPGSVKVKVHEDKDRNVTLRRLTEQEVAAEREARRLERIARNDNPQAKQEVSAMKDGTGKGSGNAAGSPVSVKVKVHEDKDRNVTLRRLTEQEAAAERDARRLEPRVQRLKAKQEIKRQSENKADLEARQSEDNSAGNEVKQSKAQRAERQSQNVNTSSINNPKLLDDIEDKISRLILPELLAIKNSNTQSQQKTATVAGLGQLTAVAPHRHNNTKDLVIERREGRTRRRKYQLPIREQRHNAEHTYGSKISSGAILTPPQTPNAAQRVNSASVADLPKTSDDKSQILPSSDFNPSLPEQEIPTSEPQLFYTIPENGPPIIIPTPTTSKGKQRLPSETSLLIKYFEGGKAATGDTKRPSVRVKVMPSSKSEAAMSSNHIQVTEERVLGSHRRARGQMEII